MTLSITMSITLIGGPTALIELDGFRLLTDPTFDAPGAYQLPHVKLEKLIGPALTADEIGEIDAVLLSHDQHSDNLDRSGKDFLAKAERVLTTEAGAKRLGNGVQNLAAGIVLVPFAYAFADVGEIVPSARLAAAFAFLVLGGSILAYLLWFHLLKVCGATAASAYHFLMPPLGMLFAWLVLGEHVAFRDMLGIVPVALGIYLVTRPNPSGTRSTPSSPSSAPSLR